ncbi:MAG: hypothetical protein AMJ55_10340 [Gammaproteobacteria bacterium SG8_15]|nr:MAG: hypothetical protein AMJ55_10340 [Gammaproteobacteria bacterium SG8_15]
MTKLPNLPVEEWEETKNTLHLFMQIVGKIRLALFPKQNHWWHVPLYVSSRGITTRSIPYNDKPFEIAFDVIDHQLKITCSSGQTKSFPLAGQSVASFYHNVFSNLQELGIEVSIIAKPYDVPFSTIPFADDTQHASYDPVAIEKYWHILLFVNAVFERFRGEFLGKSTPVHMFWHHADLALTRFSGKAAPPLKGGTNADQEAYSHEVISFGFWMGDNIVREPAFYTYAYPEPQNLSDKPLNIEGASWNKDFGYSMLYYPFESLRQVDDPEAELLHYLRSGYELMAKAAGWDIESFQRK